MNLFYTASFDASIYLQQPYQNTGIDEILEVSKQYYGDTKDVARTLIKFDLTAISRSIASGEIPSGSFTASLELKLAEANEIPATITLEAYPISQSWENGTGTRFDKISTNGVTWIYRNGDDTTSIWNDDIVGITASFSAGTTGSWTGYGGTWYTSSIDSNTYSYVLDDVTFDLTNQIHTWLSGSYDNNGLIIKYNSSAEEDRVDYGSVKFFSKETNTIYQPKLKISWQESNISTGSLAAVGNRQYRVYSSNLKNQYKVNQKVTVKLVARELYPVKQFNPITSGNVYPTFEYQTGYKLPTESYYTIKDTITKETIVPYDVNSKVIMGTDSNLIRLNFTNFAYGRVYTLVVKTIEDYNEEEFELGDFEIIK